jgi:hypothetical protein
MLKKKNIITILSVLLIGLTVLVPAYGAEVNTSHPNFFSQFISFIAQKFGLDKTKLQNAANQFKEQKKTEIKQNKLNPEKARLDQLVKDGKITQAQEDLILKELTDLRTKYSPANLKILTAEERQKQMQAEQDELKAWLQANSINLNLIMPGSNSRPSNMPRPSDKLEPSGLLRPSDMLRPSGMMLKGRFPGQGRWDEITATSTP